MLESVLILYLKFYCINIFLSFRFEYNVKSGAWTEVKSHVKMSFTQQTLLLFVKT